MHDWLDLTPCQTSLAVGHTFYSQCATSLGQCSKLVGVFLFILYFYLSYIHQISLNLITSTNQKIEDGENEHAISSTRRADCEETEGWWFDCRQCCTSVNHRRGESTSDYFRWNDDDNHIRSFRIIYRIFPMTAWWIFSAVSISKFHWLKPSEINQKWEVE